MMMTFGIKLLNEDSDIYPLEGVKAEERTSAGTFAAVALVSLLCLVQQSFVLASPPYKTKPIRFPPSWILCMLSSRRIFFEVLPNNSLLFFSSSNHHFQITVSGRKDGTVKNMRSS